MRSKFLPWIVALAAVSSGCSPEGDGLPREAIWGQVTLDGKPLASGMITFTPTNAPEPIASALVEEGAYEIPRDRGPVPGPHRVSIWAREATGKKVPNPDDPESLIDEMRDLLPPRYNLQSELSAEVRADGDKTFDFTLTSAPALR